MSKTKIVINGGYSSLFIKRKEMMTSMGYFGFTTGTFTFAHYLWVIYETYFLFLSSNSFLKYFFAIYYKQWATLNILNILNKSITCFIFIYLLLFYFFNHHAFRELLTRRAMNRASFKRCKYFLRKQKD